MAQFVKHLVQQPKNFGFSSSSCPTFCTHKPDSPRACFLNRQIETVSGMSNFPSKKLSLGTVCRLYLVDVAWPHSVTVVQLVERLVQQPKHCLFKSCSCPVLCMHRPDSSLAWFLNRQTESVSGMPDFPSKNDHVHLSVHLCWLMSCICSKTEWEQVGFERPTLQLSDKQLYLLSHTLKAKGIDHM